MTSDATVATRKESRSALLRRSSPPLALGLIAGAGTTFGAFSYGTGLFLLTPICIGIGAAWIPRGPRPAIGTCVWAAIVTCLAVSLLFLIMGLEGIFCLIMAAPLVLPGAAVGGAIGCGLRRTWEQPGTGAMLLLLATAPAFLAFDRPAHDAMVDTQPSLKITTSMIVHATADQVWRQTVDFAPITSAPVGLLRLGIAYPTHAVLREEGGRRIRECHFTTGAFIEPITTWDPPFHLAFDVAAQPPSMQELSPWDIHPPHVDTLLRSQRGEFKITPLPDGTTRLEGTTWYTIGASPAWYWQLWTDPILHAIHRRVLESIAEHAQSAAKPSP